MKLQNIELFTNEHDILMLKINNTGKKFNTYISLKKAASILFTEQDASKLLTVKKYGKELIQVEHIDGKGKFIVGMTNINAVLDNKADLEKLFKAIYDESNNEK